LRHIAGAVRLVAVEDVRHSGIADVRWTAANLGTIEVPVEWSDVLDAGIVGETGGPVEGIVHHADGPSFPHQIAPTVVDWSHPLVVVLVLDHRQPDLVQVGKALRFVGAAASVDEDRQENADQNGDDSNDNQKLDERESAGSVPFKAE